MFEKQMNHEEQALWSPHEPLIDSKMFEVFLINLDRSTDRLERFRRRCEATDLEFSRVSAVDGSQAKNLEKIKPKRQKRYYRPLVGGEIACYLSHLHALRSFLASSAKYGVILEDDAIPVDDFKEQLKSILNHHIASPSWDILKLDGYKKGKLKRISFPSGQSLVEFNAIPGLATGLVWTRSAAQNFLEKHPDSEIEIPIDVEIRRAWEFRSTVLIADPPLVNAEDASSGEATTIGGRWDKDLSSLDRLLGRLRKLSYNAKFSFARLSNNVKRLGLLDTVRLELGQNISRP